MILFERLISYKSKNMLKTIKIIFNTTIIVLALIGFNAIGGQKYIEMIKDGIVNFVAQHNEDAAKKFGDFSQLNEEFEIDKTVSIASYKAIIAEHKASGQKMIILDTGKKIILTQDDIQSPNLDDKLKDAVDKVKYHGIRIKDIRIVDRGTMSAYGKTVPYAKFEAELTHSPIPDISGTVSVLTTSDGSEKLMLSLSEKKKYSQLITSEFFKGVNEG